MVSVLFGTINSYTDLGLFLYDVEITDPVPKRELVSVPGRDGTLDLTYGLTGNEVAFENREMTLKFAMQDYENESESKFSEIYNQIHGRRFRVRFDNDPDWYWDAFCTMEKPKKNQNKLDITVKGDLYPYKHKDHVIEVTSTANGGTVICHNSRQRVYPEITTSAAITVAFGSTTVSLAAGTHKNTAIRFSPGVNELTITGAANVIIKYSEGSL